MVSLIYKWTQAALCSGKAFNFKGESCLLYQVASVVRWNEISIKVNAEIALTVCFLRYLI